MADELPRAVSRATMQIGGLTLVVYHLDNGQRVIDADSMNRWMHWMQTGEALEPAIDLTAEEMP